MKLQKKKTKNKNKKTETTQQRSSTIPESGSSSTIPEEEAGGGVGGLGGGVSLIISQGQVNSIKVIASKSCVLLRYMKFRHQLIFITGVRLGSFLTIN